MKFAALLAGLPGIIGVKAATDPEIARVCEDSRKVRPGDLFVARSGTKTSGGQFAADAVAKGAVAVVSAEPLEVPVPFARVENANLAVALLAHKVLGHPASGMKVLAVTGTKGKTTIAYLLRSILRAAGHTCGLIGTVQIDDGKQVVEAEMTTPGAVELAALFARMRANGVTHCVMEVSSHALHQHRVAGIDFAVGMFTNLTGDHLDYHKTMDEYAAAKAILFANLAPAAWGIVNADDAYADRMARDCKAHVWRYRVEAEGASRQDAEWSARIVEMTSVGTRLVIRGPAGEGPAASIEFDSPLVGRHNTYNTLCALAGARAAGVPLAQALEGLRRMAGVPGRLQPVILRDVPRERLGFQVFVDYAHTHDSLENVLKALRATIVGGQRGGRLICVFGCGGDRDRTKRPKMAAVAERLADVVIVTSDNPRTEDPAAIIGEIKTGFGPASAGKVRIDPDRRGAIRAAVGEARRGDVVLIAGKGHENYQIVGRTKHHFDDVEEAAAAMQARSAQPQETAVRT